MTDAATHALGRRARSAGGLLLLAASAGLAGCSDFLSTEPKGELTTGVFFQTPEHALQATNATYSQLRAWSVHVFGWLGMTEIVSDDATKGSTPTDSGDQLALDNLIFDPGNGLIRDPWTGYYQGIYRANVAIQGIAGIDMDATLKARLIGENKFLRAYYYFFLVRAYGGVPLITEPLRPNEYRQERATREAVYAQIEQDLKDAIAALPESYSGGDLGRVTRGAAQGMLAQVNLYQQDWAEAYQYAKQVIDSGKHGLYPDYAALFTQAGENSRESLFEVQTSALAAGGGGSQYSEVQGVRGEPNLGWGFNTPSDDLETAYEPGDPRLQATILYPWEILPDNSGAVVRFNATIPNNQYNQKTFTPLDNPLGNGNSGTNIRRLRYADVLLIAAEAAYRLGNEGDARLYLNQVRERARGGQAVTLGFTPEALSDSVATSIGLASSSRVFVRYVREGSPAHGAGLRSFDSYRDAARAPLPVGINTLDVIEAVNGTAVATVAQYNSAIAGLAAGGTATLQVRRVTGEGAQTLTLSVPVQALLPNVTASGQALLDAIWHERRVELAMEQQRWFDLIRQGRAAQAMAAVGKTFRTGTHELFPIPASEVTIAGLQQNPGY